MRDYLSPAKKMVERIIPHPAAARAFVIKRRSFVFGMTASLILVLTLGIVTVRAITTPKISTESVVKSEGKTSTMTTTNTTQPSAAPEQPAPTQSTTIESKTESSQSSDPQTSVTINNEQVSVPPNGSVSRTITNDKGTTHIDISTSSDSAGNTYSSSFTTNSTNMNSSVVSNSQSMHITTQ